MKTRGCLNHRKCLRTFPGGSRDPAGPHSSAKSEQQLDTGSRHPQGRPGPWGGLETWQVAATSQVGRGTASKSSLNHGLCGPSTVTWADLKPMIYARLACSASANLRSRGDPPCPSRPLQGPGLPWGCLEASGRRLRGLRGAQGALARPTKKSHFLK